MALTISVGSGKGGTGKSTFLSNIALLLAKSGKRVCVVDLDVGGANAHILFGLFQPKYTITDFITRKVNSIDEAIHTFEGFYGLQLLPGSGETLRTANMTFQEKLRLLRSISKIDTDIVLIDIGAGTGYHGLDFFMFSDLQICVTMAEPTSIMDFYKFIQLATIRKALNSFLSHSEVSKQLQQQDFESIAEVLDLAEQVQEGARLKIEKALASFHPMLVVNRVVPGSKLNIFKLKKLTARYLGIYLPELGEIPADTCVTDAVHSYLPVTEYTPTAKSSLALQQIADKLLQVIDLFQTDRTSLDTLRKQ
ncbi:MAG: P-loop NTPase [Desulfopila sp.]|jgi:flagellar biosynthesis protein FlhG|nr:P-loop NTPase [Desulfopila sp.]